MHPRRSLAALWLVITLAACASAPTRRPAPAAELNVDLAVSPMRARDELVAAFKANGLPVALAQPGAVEFHAQRERGPLGYYEVFARAVIVPADCGTHVTLFGEETYYPNATATQGTSAIRIGPSSSGRALDVWHRLQSVAATIRADSLGGRTGA